MDNILHLVFLWENLFECIAFSSCTHLKGTQVGWFLYFTNELDLWGILCVFIKSAKKSADLQMNGLHVLWKNSLYFKGNLSWNSCVTLVIKGSQPLWTETHFCKTWWVFSLPDEPGRKSHFLMKVKAMHHIAKPKNNSVVGFRMQ